MSRVFALTVAAICGLSFGCNRPTLDVSWTIDGADPADACEGDDKIVLVSSIIDRGDQPPERAETALSCDAATGEVTLGSSTTITAKHMRGDAEIGLAGPVTVSISADRIDPLQLDIEPTAGRAQASFTVNGQPCEDAGAGNFDVVVRTRVVSGDFEPLEGAPTTASCGEVLETPLVPFGTSIRISASGLVGGEPFTTSTLGTEFDISRATVVGTVDLTNEDRPE